MFCTASSFVAVLGVSLAFLLCDMTVVVYHCRIQPIEAAHVQAYNDFIIFSVAGAGSLISGVIYAAYGWLALIYAVSGLVSSQMWREPLHVCAFLTGSVPMSRWWCTSCCSL
jgi:hypothetical protein